MKIWRSPMENLSFFYKRISDANTMKKNVRFNHFLNYKIYDIFKDIKGPLWIGYAVLSNVIPPEITYTVPFACAVDAA